MAKSFNGFQAARVGSLPLATLACAALALTTIAARADDHSEHEHHHHHAEMAAGIKQSQADYRVPALSLTRQDGTAASFPAELDDGRPVLLNFIYTTCTAICPMTTQVFSQVQGKLGGEGSHLHMISISIDPEFDTVAKLSEYAHKYGAGPQWQFYTGTAAASIEMQKAFAAYRGDKMNHEAVTFLRPAPGKPWSRIDGMAAPDELVREYRRLTTKG